MNPTQMAEDIKAYGVVCWVLYLFNRLLIKFSKALSIEQFYLFRLPVTSANRIKVPKFIKKKYALKKFTVYNPVLNFFNISKKTISERLSQKTYYFILYKGDDVIGMIWIAEKNYEEDIAYCRYVLGDKMVWDFDLYILEKYRNTPAFAVLWDAILDYLQQQNYSQVLSRINATNIQSVKVHQRLGGSIISYAVFIKFFLYQICVDCDDFKISRHDAVNRKKFVFID